MKAKFKPCQLNGRVEAPPSKSMTHRYLIGAALSNGISQISGIDYSEDILASLDCLQALGAKIAIDKDVVTVDSSGFMNITETPILKCRESGSTLRFLIPLALCLGKKVKLQGSTRLFERPLGIYEDLCKEHHWSFEKDEKSVTLCGNFTSGSYKVRGDISSQFISGLIFALVYLGGDSTIQIIPPFESKSYVDLTIEALKSFGANLEFIDEYQIEIKPSTMRSFSGRIEGDYSNAAFLDAFNYVGSSVEVCNLNPDSLQGDRVYTDYFKELVSGTPTIDISDCPDLGPILFAVAALHHGATFTGTNRLKVKESDRGEVMKVELQKVGGDLIIGDNVIVVPKQQLMDKGIVLDGHNDHRVIMTLSVILSQIGGTIEGIEAVQKSYPNFFRDIKKLGAKVEIVNKNTSA